MRCVIERDLAVYERQQEADARLELAWTQEAYRIMHDNNGGQVLSRNIEDVREALQNDIRNDAQTIKMVDGFIDKGLRGHLTDDDLYEFNRFAVDWITNHQAWFDEFVRAREEAAEAYDEAMGF